MKRFHVHVGVADLAESIRFYSAVFGMPPTVAKPDYAKWMVEDPRLNFAISQRGSGRKGVNHLGLQADSEEELAQVRAGFEAADAKSMVHETGVACCYARSNKHWVTDPTGIAWEGFHTLGSVPMFDEASESATACCEPGDEAAAAGCCAPGATAKATAGAASPGATRCCA